MNQFIDSNKTLIDEQSKLLRVLYPIFKNELYQRRENMIRLTAFASTFLVSLLIILLALSHWARPSAQSQWLAISGVSLFSSVYAYFILQQADRHRMAKQQLIELEKVLDLYEEGWQGNREPFFPKNWQLDWTKDRSVTIYLTVLAALTIFVICAILLSTLTTG